MNERQISTALAALRMWQRETDWELRCQDDIASNVGKIEPLDDREIDQMCEALNFKPRIVLQIRNGVVQNVISDAPCDLLIIDRDEAADTELPDGSPGEVWFESLDGLSEEAVDGAFEEYKPADT